MPQLIVDDLGISLFQDNQFRVCFVDDLGNFTTCIPNGNVALSSSDNPSGIGSNVTFTATVTGSGVTPTGTVTFQDGAVVLATVTLVSGVAIFSISTLAVGTHPITATYNGDANYAGNISSVLSQVVSIQIVLPGTNIGISSGAISEEPLSGEPRISISAVNVAISGAPISLGPISGLDSKSYILKLILT